MKNFKTKIIRFKTRWLYRAICLYDKYWVGGYAFPQENLCVYSGFWDKLGKTTRSPYVYKISKWL